MSAKKNSARLRKLVVTALLSAVATVLMFLDFSVPFMPPFIKMDFSELPALIASFALGPVSGVVVCLVKNLINLLSSNTGGVGELSNFLLGCAFVLPAGLIYKRKKTRLGAFLGSLVGAIIMSGIGVLTNYYIVYPVYTVFMPMEAILGAYRAIYSGIQNLWQALLIFNLPFTFLKGMANVLMTFAVYKYISPVLKGKAL